MELERVFKKKTFNYKISAKRAGFADEEPDLTDRKSLNEIIKKRI